MHALINNQFMFRARFLYDRLSTLSRRPAEYKWLEELLRDRPQPLELFWRLLQGIILDEHAWKQYGALLLMVQLQQLSMTREIAKQYVLHTYLRNLENFRWWARTFLVWYSATLF